MQRGGAGAGGERRTSGSSSRSSSSSAAAHRSFIASGAASAQIWQGGPRAVSMATAAVEEIHVIATVSPLYPTECRHWPSLL
uniref:Uncharacterized protein n=1 Tax=Oryza meridionalis TaxID=40149 RepID=A0A0E0DCR7_9ORYZ